MSARTAKDLLGGSRRVGLVCDGVEHVLERRSRDFFACVSQATQYSIYNLDKIRRVFVSPELPGTVDAVCMHNSISGAAVGRRLFLFRTHQMVGSSEVFPARVVFRTEREALTVFLCEDGSVVIADLRAVPVLVSKAILILDKGRKAMPTCLAILPFPQPRRNGQQQTASESERTVSPRIIAGYTDGSVRIWRLDTENSAAKLLYKFKCMDKFFTQRQKATGHNEGFDVAASHDHSVIAQRSAVAARSALLEDSESSGDDDSEVNRKTAVKGGIRNLGITAITMDMERNNKDLPEMCVYLGTTTGHVAVIDAKKDVILKMIKVTESDVSVRSICTYCTSDKPPVVICTHDIPISNLKLNNKCTSGCTMLSVANMFSGEVNNYSLGHRGRGFVSHLPGEILFCLQQNGMIALLRGETMNMPGVTKMTTAPPVLTAVKMRFSPTNVVYAQARNSARVATANGIARALADGLDVFAVARVSACSSVHYRFEALPGLPEWYVDEGEKGTTFSLWSIDTIEEKRTKRLGEIQSVYYGNPKVHFDISYNCTSNVAEDTLVMSSLYTGGPITESKGTVEAALFDTHKITTKHVLYNSTMSRKMGLVNGLHCGQFSVVADNSSSLPVLRAYTYSGNDLWNVKLPRIGSNSEDKIVGLFRGCPAAATGILAKGESVISAVSKAGIIYSKLLLSIPDSLVHDYDTSHISMVRLNGLQGSITSCCLVSSFLSILADNSIHVYDLDSLAAATNTDLGSSASEKADVPCILPVHVINLGTYKSLSEVTRIESFGGPGLGILLVHSQNGVHLVDSLGGIDLGVLPLSEIIHEDTAKWNAMTETADNVPSITAENGIVFADGQTAVMINVNISKARGYRTEKFSSLNASTADDAQNSPQNIITLSSKGLHRMCTNTLRDVLTLSELTQSTSEVLQKAGVARASMGVRVPFLLSLMNAEEPVDGSAEDTLEYNGITKLWKAAEGAVAQKPIDNVLDSYEKLLTSYVAPKAGENVEYSKADAVLSSGLEKLRSSLLQLGTADRAIVGASDILGISPEYL